MMPLALAHVHLDPRAENLQIIIGESTTLMKADQTNNRIKDVLSFGFLSFDTKIQSSPFVEDSGIKLISLTFTLSEILFFCHD